MYLLTMLGKAGWENIWLEIMAYGPSAASESQIFSHPARPNLVRVFYHMTNLETKLLNIITREPVRFCSRGRAVRLFRSRSCKCVRPSYGTFINGFARKGAAPYGSFDNKKYMSQYLKS